ncbi:hypothetical protein BASA50_004055 [Batrachochytrium salamandrivorans]|uniref:C2H2-type domain-containing protein n=1 Tax=Batrachochytrium salamandrivorans TaxID=1357716 RepID=A0ABQ8FHC5_9FUNG|nr:hypothetical protein BASA62_000875 [Batrachochytrium salamandrivorans]KAH6581765.1 hypothetical protein BASA60_002258 [Batrachochytrium salamandrivorans]KAH6595960.1 hypothetical protein BASA61_003629 [Batrachochytrium salamandrivorans]KAH6598174.1 hypothetical protein BASA50_004055 [Batrachochytrium salamandrivorans]KAH9248211.1 hypothetical protein BASA81_014131 [Batrachochytrium salamandrivorans]
MAKEKPQRLRTCPLCHKEFAAKTVSNHRSQLVCIRRRQIHSADVECWRQDFENDPTMLDKLLRLYNKQQLALAEEDRQCGQTIPKPLTPMSTGARTLESQSALEKTTEQPSEPLLPSTSSIIRSAMPKPYTIASLPITDDYFDRAHMGQGASSIFSDHSMGHLTRNSRDNQSNVDLPHDHSYNYSVPQRWNTHIQGDFRMDLVEGPSNDLSWYSVQHAMRPISTQLPLLPPLHYPNQKPLHPHLGGFCDDFQLGHRPVLAAPMNHLGPPLVPPSSIHPMLQPIGHMNFDGFSTAVPRDRLNSFIYDHQRSNNSNRDM